MPIYEYQGQQYDIGTEDPNEAKLKILSFLEKGSRQKTNVVEDLVAGLNSAVNTMGQGVIYSGASLAGTLGAKDLSESLYDTYNKYDKQFGEAESKVDRGETGKVFKAIGQIPAYLNPVTAGLMVGGGGVKTGTDIINEGGSEDAAKQAQAFDMGSALAMYGLGPFTNVPGRVANAGVQAGINVAQEAGLNHPVQSIIRANEGLKELPDMTIGDYAASAVPGAVFGALSPKKGKPSEIPLPDDTPVVDVDKVYVARQEARVTSIQKQIDALSKKQEAIVRQSGGILTEKQLELFKSLEEQKVAKQEEATGIQKNIDAYGKPTTEEQVANLSVEDMVGKLPEEVKTPKQELVTPENTSKSPMVEFSPEGDRVYLRDRKAAEELYLKLGGDPNKLRKPKTRPISEIAKELRDTEEQYTALIKEGKYGEAKLVARSKDLLTKEFFEAKARNKQKGSWTPFESSEEPRPDESNAPGIHEPQPRKSGVGFRKFIREKVPQDFDDPRHRQPPPPIDEGLTLAEWKTRDDGVDPFGEPPKDSRELAIYNQKRVELERAGILETPVGDESDVRYRQRGFKTRESANNYVKMLEGQVESQRKTVKKLEENLHTPVGSEIELENAKIRLSEMEARLGSYRSKDMGWKEDKVSKPQITETFSLDDDANKTIEQVKQDRIDAGLDPLPQPPRGPGFSQKGAVDLFASNEKAKNEDTSQIAKRLRNENFSKVVDVTNLRTSDELLTEMTSSGAKDYGGFLTKGERAMFGFQQFVEAIKRKAPLVWEQAKRIRVAENGEVEAKRLIWHGENTEGKSGYGPFRKLKHTQNPDSMETLLPTLTANDKIVLTEFLVNNSENRVKHTKADMSELTTHQKRAVEIIQTFLDRTHQMMGVKYRNGFIPAIRKGDFAVGIKTSLGDLFHVEPAPTKEIADKMKTFLESKGYHTTDVIDFKQEKGTPLSDSFNIVKETLSDLKERLPETDSATALKALDDVQLWISKHSTPGKHNVRASLYTGYKGTSLVKGRRQNAEDFFNSFKGYLDEVAAQTKKNKLGRDTTEFWESESGRKLKELFPNQYDTSMYLTDVAMNRNQDITVKHEGKDVPVVKAFDDMARKVVDDFVSRQVNAIGENLKARGISKDFNPFYYPEVPILDRGIGLAAQLFYIRTLTSRPAFWAGQILSSPFSVRQFLKEGTLLDTLVAQGKAWGTIMSGGDKDFQAFYNDIRQSRDTIKPQFIVDINRVPIVEDVEHPTLNKFFMWGTGQEQASIADSASRYFTLAMAYHFYKDMGLTGDKLKENSVAMAELTMQMYNRANSPPILNKLGIVGQNIAPLQKYGLGQLSNLIGDIRYMAEQPGMAGKLRGALPALSTLLVTTIMGGATGISLLTEYEMIRYLGVKLAGFFGKDWSEAWPSAIESMMKHQNFFQQGVQKGYQALGANEQFAKDASTHGIPSAVTGHDIGSSLRFNPYVGEAILKQNYAPIDNFPIVKQMIDMAFVGLVKAKKIVGGDVKNAEERKADLSMQLMVGQNYLVDKLKYGSDTRAFVPGGGRYYGQVDQTKAEQLGQLIGSPTLETAKDRKVVELMERDEKTLAQKKQDAVDLFVDAYIDGDQKGKDRAIELAKKAKMSDKQIMTAVKAALVQRNKSRLDAMTTNKKGLPSSNEQKRKYLERLEYE